MRSGSRGVRVPPRVGVARASRAVLVQGAGRAVPGGLCPSAFPALVSFSALLARGGWPRPFLPPPSSGSRAPSRIGLFLRGSPACGGRGGEEEGRPLAAPLWGVVGSGSVGGARRVEDRGSLCLGSSLWVPCTGTKAGFVGAAQSMQDAAAILLRLASVRSCSGPARGGRREASCFSDTWLAGRLAGW